MQAALLSFAFAGILGQTPTSNLDLGLGTLTGWEGGGFFLVTDPQTSSKLALSSEDAGSASRKGMIRHIFDVPAGAGLITFTAQAINAQADGKLDVLLLGRGRIVIPRLVRTEKGWSEAGTLDAQRREYAWDVSKLAGSTLQVVLLDDDDRPGRHVLCSGFQIMPHQDPLIERFAREMVKLQEECGMHAMLRYDSKRFTALSNAGERFSTQCLRHCELMHDLFFDHFTRKGFELEQPSGRLMLAIFDTPQGFEAYLRRKLPATITGVYHPQSNRLVIYDLARNQALLAQRNKALKQGPKEASEFRRSIFVETVERQARERSNDANLSTIMHEAAHQISFNCGMLHRHRDVPIWLGEGLACYCEVTENGSWHGIGELNLHRIDELKAAQRNGRSLLLPEELIRADDWRNDGRKLLLGYAQSWALFHMLMHEQPLKVRQYLELISTRQASDYRLLDFCQVFGSDLRRLEQRHNNYVRKVIDQAR